MAAVVYLRIVMKGGFTEHTYLLAKTQAATLRMVTMPMLEIQSCLMTVKLLRFIEKHLDLPSVKVSLWIDSRVALAWIKSEIRLWQTELHQYKSAGK